jgi:hypothetical protein
MGLYEIIWGIYGEQWNCKDKNGDFGDGNRLFFGVRRCPFCLWGVPPNHLTH